MMYSEFEKLMKKPIPYEDFLEIEKVYMFFDSLEKQDMSQIYKFGKNIVTKMCIDIDCMRRENSMTIAKLEKRLAIRLAYIEELETQLQQCRTYVADLTATINNNICKDFSPNIGG